MEDRACSRLPAGQRLPEADARLVEQIRSGNAEAGHEFVREHYGAIYRYLLYLTEQPDVAEDLTQETFLQGWSRLDSFQGQGRLRSWLLRIAHRQFLDLLRRRQAELGLDGIAEVAAPDATAWMETVELRGVIDRLPLEEREILLLHHLEGYTSSEIAGIVGVPARTVRLRLAQAREHLRQELGGDDLTYLNEPTAPMRQWAWLPLDQMHALETRLALGGEDKEDEMERREFLRQAAVGAAGLALSEPGKEVVDGRLTQKVNLAFKGTALSDLCDQLRTETGVHLTAGASVADEKVTLFCKAMPLRDVMRQLSRPFGYSWVRSARKGEYRYELTQDLRSQLLEEELRNRDRNEALLALEREIERYRAYLDLSPDEALARAKTAPPTEKKRLEKLGGYGWGPIQMYFRLSNQDLMTLRAGQTLTFSGAPRPGEQPLAPELARGVLQSYRDWRWRQESGAESFYPLDPVHPPAHPGDPLLSAMPELRASITLTMAQSELGEFTLDGLSGVFLPKGFFATKDGMGPYATGRSPAVLKPDNHAANRKLAGDPTLRRPVTIQPQPSCRSTQPSPQSPPPRGGAEASASPEPRVTTADVLEVLHQATGLPIVADYYTRLYKPAEVSVSNLSLFDALNQLADTMRMRWRSDSDGSWLQFRSVSFYDDRLKEVPNRLLVRWSAARSRQGMLRLEDLLQIAQLPDAHLDASEMAAGARECWGLAEWDVACHEPLRPHLRYLATLTPEQRRMAMSTEGLPFTRMSLAQQQQFIALALLSEPLSLQELEGAALRVDYSQPGGFQWGDPCLAFTPAPWVVIVEPGPEGRWLPRPLLRGRTREAVAQAVLRLDPKFRGSAVHALRSQRPTPDAPPLEAQIFPTDLSLNVIYLPVASNRLPIHIVGSKGWDTRQGLD